MQKIYFWRFVYIKGRFFVFFWWKKLKKTLDMGVALWYNISTSAKGFFLCAHFLKTDGAQKAFPRAAQMGWRGSFQREVHRPPMRRRSNKFYIGGAAKWRMTHALRLLSHAPSASREITTLRKTRKMTRTDWSS